ncbi:hypothetical protein BY996DRAFT_4574955 [Phakopsora pachyrhizi]|uniref:MARVEL domain-containing protein n=1 Tax=Phakopsora pachyrhizi TaxID=170000 RepID=A0A0S1MJV9_PHAPC|nr:hypothetical protein BY996DRAFT_4574955 [Phakopsora pachyrhizi]
MVNSGFTSGQGPVSNSLWRIVYPALYALILLFSIIEFLLTAVLISDYERGDYPNDSIRDRIRFILFSSCWNIVFIPIILVASLRATNSFIASATLNLALSAITWIFWLSAAASWTHALGGTLHCGDIFLMGQTINISIPYCEALVTVQAFSWMIWITLTGALACVAARFSQAAQQDTGSGPMRESQASQI